MATFPRGADKAIDQVKSIYAQRGEMYKDSWALENQKNAITLATCHAFGWDPTPEQVRLLQAASLCDIKDSRLGGPWNIDSLLDGIAYRAFYTTLRDEWEAGEELSRS